MALVAPLDTGIANVLIVIPAVVAKLAKFGNSFSHMRFGL